jgi:DnaJ-class molecular chaperone
MKKDKIMDICPACEGHGTVAGKTYKGKKCPECKGKGKIVFTLVGRFIELPQ